MKLKTRKAILSAFFLLMMVVLTYVPVFAQAGDSTMTPRSDSSRYITRQKCIIAGLTAHQLATIYVEYKWWWEGHYHAFVLENDGGFNNYSFGVDKCGHFYTSYMYFNALNELLKWGEFSQKKRLFVSAAIPFMWALSIEIGDGFSNYDFSPTDLLANSLGIGYGLLQEEVPYLRNFKFKFSYFPSGFYQNNNYKGWSLTADYNGHIYWMSMDVNNLLPKPAKRYWPKYLNLSVGYGMVGFAETNFNHGGSGVDSRERKYCIGLDWNLGAFSAKTKTGKTINNILDYYHFPAPGLKKTGAGPFKPQLLLLN